MQGWVSEGGHPHGLPDGEPLLWDRACQRGSRADRPALARRIQIQLVRAVWFASQGGDDDDDDRNDHQHEEQDSEDEPREAPPASARSAQASLAGPRESTQQWSVTRRGR